MANKARILIADTLAKQGIEMLSREHEVEVKTGLSEDELVQAVAGVQYARSWAATWSACACVMTARSTFSPR